MAMQRNIPSDTTPASGVIDWSLQQYLDRLVMTTSFGVHSAVLLDLVTGVVPGIPVLFVDTGFHFKETYTYADELTERFSLNLVVCQSDVSPAWWVARHGELWQEGDEGLDEYDRMRKVVPLRREMAKRGVAAWLSGVRRSQTTFRESLQVVEDRRGFSKIHPLLSWTDQDMEQYLSDHDLPRHPLQAEGYASIGDHTTTLPSSGDESGRSGRFMGKKEECGIHTLLDGEEPVPEIVISAQGGE
ncbi:MAG: phosphoadenylyl-sulfate reductase [Phycisphaerales bacterium]|nr:phosphoadenylyl-sulfate reductase [Phycisphaerales bacterium]